MDQTMPRQPEPELIDLPEEAAAYAHADFAEVNQSFVARLVAFAEADEARCLELGTGPADIPIRLVKAHPKWRITAVEASPPMLGFARYAIDRAGLSKSITLVQADAKDTGLAGRSFDIVFANSTLHHVNNVLGFWEEIKRVTSEGSLIFIRDLHRPPSIEAAAEIVRRYAAAESQLLQAEYRRSLLAAYSHQEVRAQLGAVGLGHLKVEVVTDRHMDIYGRIV
jgi:ubiquinone/menaquinone biosynthesis C-methylase UbiE